MNNIEVLDCTLRDGGYVNDWNFGHHAIYNIFSRLSASNIDIIELGFLNDSRDFNIDYTIQPNSKYLPDVYNFSLKKSAKLVAMIIYGECSIDNVGLQSEAQVDGIRLVFKKKKMEEAMAFARQLKEKGYEIFLQPASVTDYSDEDVHDLCVAANALNVHALYIVDTYGLMGHKKVLSYFKLFDKYCNKEIKIGFHSHNNMQLSYGSAVQLLELESDRHIIIDSSLFGMGKGTGNLNTELITDYLNKNYDKNYDVFQILELIDSEILKIKRIFEWGYSLNGFIAASNDCHPEYVKFLLNKKTLSIKAINTILTRLQQGTKTSFDKNQIENLYFEYQSREIDDSKALASLSKIFSDKKLLLLMPGASLETEKSKIESFISSNNPIVISVNHIPTRFNPDFVFVSNGKRYDQMLEELDKHKNVKLIVTSNVQQALAEFDFVLNYSQLIMDGDKVIISDNAALMLIKALVRIGRKNDVYIAGMDGFSKDANNYAEEYLSYNINTDTDRQNELIKNSINNFKSQITVQFITKSKYI